MLNLHSSISIDIHFIFLGISFPTSKDDLNLLLCNPYHDHVFCFEFLCEREDEMLQLLSENEEFELQGTAQWFKNSDIVKDVALKIKQFTSFVSANHTSKEKAFVVTSHISDSTSTDTVANIAVYHLGNLLLSTFTPPSTPTKPEICDVTNDSVTLSWETPADYGNITGYVITCTDSTSTELKQSIKEVRALSSASQITIHDLTPGNYTLKLFSYNDYGNSETVKVDVKIGNTASHLTQSSSTSNHNLKQELGNRPRVQVKPKSICTEVCSKPGEPSSIEVTQRTIAIVWPMPSNNHHLVSCYYIHYRKHNESRDSSAKVVANGSTNRAKIVNLEPSTSYIVYVVAECQSGAIVEGRESIFKTKEGTFSPPGRPKAVKIESFSIELKWTPPARNSKAVKSYVIYYYTQTNPNNKLKQEVPSMRTSIIISQLQPNTTYIFKVVGHCATGESVESEESDPITTESCVCTQPGKPTALRVSQSSITLIWDEPAERSEYIQYYYVYYRSLDGQNNKWVKATTKDATKEIEFLHLSINTNYVFKIIAHCEFGNSRESEVSDVITTAHKVCSKPGKPKAHEILPNAIKLKWPKPVKNSDYVTSYYVLYRKQMKKNWTTIQTKNDKHEILIDQLEPSTKYIFKVIAHCLSGDSVEGDESDVVTTKDAVCSKPGKPTPVEVGQDRIRLRWPRPRKCSEYVILYYVYYRLENDRRKRWYVTESVDATCEIEFYSLHPNTRYVFKVAAQCECGTSEESEESDPVSTAHAICSAPGKPKASEVRQDRIKLTWAMPKDGYEYIQCYYVYYHEINSPINNWIKIETDDSNREIAVLQLKPATAYVFKVAGHCMGGSDSDESAQSNPITTMSEVCGPPGQPKASLVTQNSITLNWSKPKERSNLVIKEYHILCCSQGNDWVTAMTCPGTTETGDITGLQPSTSYQFKIQAECMNGTYSEESEVSNVIETRELKLAEKIIPQLKLIPSKSINDDFSFYRLDSSMQEEMRDAKNRIAKYGFEKPRSGVVKKLKQYVHVKMGDTGAREEKVLLIVGATGAGKSTLINGIINYIFGVEWEDKYRIKLILDETTQSQAHSQTAWITAYTFYWQAGFPFPYTLTIVDTPGFGDTRGIQRDNEIVSQIKHLFELKKKDGGIDIIHGIGFVAQAGQARLTQTQRYIFDSILSIFGNDVANNICIMATFADGGKPPVMEAIKEAKVPCKKYFKFNNSALVGDMGDNFAKMFWHMGIQSFKEFFDFFNDSESASLQLTREVLKEREHLETSIAGIQPLIRTGLSKMDVIKQEEQVLLTHESQIKDNKNFTYIVDTVQIIKVDLEPGVYVTNCLECNTTCHYPCKIPDDGKKFCCAAMKNIGFEASAICNVCPNNCSWKKHRNNPFRIDTKNCERRTNVRRS